MKVIKGSLEDLKRMQKKHSAEQAKAEKQAKEQARQKQSASGSAATAALSSEDAALFRQSVKGVTPLPGSNRIPHVATPKSASALVLARRAQAEGKAVAALNPAPGARQDTRPVQVDKNLPTDDSSYVQHAHSKDLLKKLARGTWPVSATLDLHGTTAEQAAERFDRFIQSCLQHQVRCVCIIHGKGYGSKDGQSVLKDMVKAWLRQLEATQAFIQAPESLGGTGALLVLLNTKT